MQNIIFCKLHPNRQGENKLFLFGEIFLKSSIFKL